MSSSMVWAPPGGRTLAVQSSPCDIQLLNMIREHRFQNTKVEINCHTILKLFRPDLGFFGCDIRLAADALRGYMCLDEANTCPESALGSAAPCAKTGRTRRLDSDLLHATLELVREKSARSSRVALSVMKAVARRKGRFFANDPVVCKKPSLPSGHSFHH